MKPLTDKEIAELPEYELCRANAMHSTGDRVVGFIHGIRAMERLRNEQLTESMRLLRELAEIQNGPPLEQVKTEWTELMNQVWNFLDENEQK